MKKGGPGLIAEYHISIILSPAAYPYSQKEETDGTPLQVGGALKI
ncbi:MAG: hypothetical protein V3S16_03115 [Candidatus Desulfatibia sp.]